MKDGDKTLDKDKRLSGSTRIKDLNPKIIQTHIINQSPSSYNGNPHCFQNEHKFLGSTHTHTHGQTHAQFNPTSAPSFQLTGVKLMF